MKNTRYLVEKNIQVNNEEIKCTLSFSNRKSIALKVKENGQIIIYAPRGISPEYIDNIIKEKEQWIWNNIQKMKTLEKVHFFDKMSLSELKNGSVLMFKGKSYNLQIFKLGRKNKVYFDGDFVIAYVKDIDNREELANLIEDFYREYARKVFEEKVKIFAEKMQVSYGRISIKEQKTRWGSCSSKGNLNFNWKVVKAPEFVIDYLVVHELAHRKEMNHSDRFWNVVESTLPDYKKGKEWLKVNGKSLL